MEKTAQDIIIRPIITEASMDALADRKYTFKVAKTANKIEIKKAVEQLFKDVKVEKVNTMNVRGRKKRMGRNEGHRYNNPRFQNHRVLRRHDLSKELNYNGYKNL